MTNSLHTVTTEATRSVLVTALQNKAFADDASDTRQADYYAELIIGLARVLQTDKLTASEMLDVMRTERDALGSWAKALPIVGKLTDDATRTGSPVRGRFALVSLFSAFDLYDTESDSPVATGWTSSQWETAVTVMTRGVNLKVLNASKVARIGRRHADVTSAYAEVTAIVRAADKADKADKSDAPSAASNSPRTDAQRVAIISVELAHLSKSFGADHKAVRAASAAMADLFAEIEHASSVSA